MTLEPPGLEIATKKIAGILAVAAGSFIETTLDVFPIRLHRLKDRRERSQGGLDALECQPGAIEVSAAKRRVLVKVVQELTGSFQRRAKRVDGFTNALGGQANAVEHITEAIPRPTEGGDIFKEAINTRIERINNAAGESGLRGFASDGKPFAAELEAEGGCGEGHKVRSPDRASFNAATR